MDFTGEYSTLIIEQQDHPGIIAHLTQCLSDHGINIAFMKMFRSEKGATAYTVIESDEKISDEVLEEMRKVPLVDDVRLIQN